LLIVIETRDPFDPTSPRREASLFNSPGLLARRFFGLRKSDKKGAQNAAGSGNLAPRTPFDVEVRTL